MFKPSIWLSAGVVFALLSGTSIAEESLKKGPSTPRASTEIIKPAAKMHKKHQTVISKKMEEKKAS